MLYRSIPKVDVLLEDPEIQGLIETYSRDTVVESIHLEMDALRKYIGTCEDEEKAKEQIGNLNMNVRRTVTAMHTPNMRSVINGTGTILHTNLGERSQIEDIENFASVFYTAKRTGGDMNRRTAGSWCRRGNSRTDHCRQIRKAGPWAARWRKP